MKGDQSITFREAISRAYIAAGKSRTNESIITLPTRNIFFCRNPFMREISVAIFRGSEEEISQAVRNDPINLFWHAPVKRAESGFHMPDPDA